MNVFKPYGITVDFRHIFLTADFITFNGRIRPLTREGMKVRFIEIASILWLLLKKKTLHHTNIVYPFNPQPITE